MEMGWGWWGTTAIGALLSVTAAAAPILDPHGLLAQIDAAYGSRTFADAYQKGDQATVRQLNWDCFSFCTDFFGLRICPPFCRQSWEPGQPDHLDEVVDATAQEATVVRADGTTEPLSEENFRADGRHSLRSVLRSLDVILSLKGEVKPTSLKEVEFPMTDQAPVPAFNLRGEFLESEGGKLFFEVVLAKQAPAIAEILFVNLAATPQNLDNQEAVKLFRVRSFQRTAR